MKTLLFAVTVAAGLCAVSSLQAPTTTTSPAKTSRNNSTATATGTAAPTTATTATGTISRSNSRFTTTRKPAPAVAARPAQVDGVVPRAIRSGNPLQMINPFAPAAYGDGRDVTRREPSDPYQRPEGIKLVTVEF